MSEEREMNAEEFSKKHYNELWSSHEYMEAYAQYKISQPRKPRKVLVRDNPGKRWIEARFIIDLHIYSKEVDYPIIVLIDRKFDRFKFMKELPTENDLRIEQLEKEIQEKQNELNELKR